MSELKQYLERLYTKWNKRKFISPDPLEFLYDYADPADQEVVGFLAAVFAYGRVENILKGVKKVLMPLGQSPAGILKKGSWDVLFRGVPSFKYRFYSERDILSLLRGLQGVLNKFGSLKNCFSSEEGFERKNYSFGLDKLTQCLKKEGGSLHSHMLPSGQSSRKRLYLFLRWMIRRDEVDPGLWDFDPAFLLYPVDVHMLKIGRALGFTSRKTGSCKTALEITEGFCNLCPDDPLRYDFALTREGINPLGEEEGLLRTLRKFETVSG